MAGDSWDSILALADLIGDPRYITVATACQYSQEELAELLGMIHEEIESLRDEGAA